MCLVFLMFAFSPQARHQFINKLTYFSSSLFHMYRKTNHTTMSSANCDSLILPGGFGMSLTNKLKRIGDRQDPCGTPATCCVSSETVVDAFDFPSLIVLIFLLRESNCFRRQTD